MCGGEQSDRRDKEVRGGERDSERENCEKLNRLHLKKRAGSDKECEAVTCILSGVQWNESSVSRFKGTLTICFKKYFNMFTRIQRDNWYIFSWYNSLYREKNNIIDEVTKWLTKWKHRYKSSSLRYSYILKFLWHGCVTISVQSHLLPKYSNSASGPVPGR